MPAATDLRLLRAAVFAAACAALAAAGHLAGGAQQVPLAALGCGWALIFALCVPLAGRERRSLAGTAALLAGGQVVLHCLFSRLGGHGSSGMAESADAGPLALAARLLCNDYALTLTPAEAERIVREAGLAPAPAGMGTTDALRVLGEGPMLAGHLLAALATGWLLLRGEAALWRLVRLSAEALPWTPLAAMQLLRALSAAEPPAPGAPAGPRADRHPTTAASGTVLPDAVIRRGPPAPPAFALAA